MDDDLFCTNCGQKNESISNYCANCGHQLVESEENESRTANVEPLEQQIEQNENDETANQETGQQANIDLQPNEEVEFSEEEKLIQQVETSNKKRWIPALIIVLLLLVGGGTVFAIAQLQGESNFVQEEAEEQTELFNENEEQKVDFSIVKASTVNYPEIAIKVRVEGQIDEELAKNIDQFKLLEKGQSQKITRMEALATDDYELYYETNNQNDSMASEIREVELTYGDLSKKITYQSIAQKPLTVDHFSCNTDAYPMVSCFFSVYDERNIRLDNLAFLPEMIHLLEDDKQVSDVKFEKMNQSQIYTSTNVVMDLSTSMQNNDRIGQIKSNIQTFLDGVTIQQNNLIGLLTFADREYITQYPFTSNKESIRQNVLNMSTQGNCTALYEAINTAIFNTSYNEVAGSKYVIVFTDGEENCSDYVSAETLIQNALQLGVTIYAISESNYSELAHIATETNGSYTNIGEDYSLLQQFYKDIYENKRTQYVLTYKSENPKKQARDIKFSVANHHYRTNETINTVSPKLIDNYEVADVMQQYQIAWSIALSNQDVSAVYPYVTSHHPITNDNSVYNIMYDQIYGALNKDGQRNGGTIHVDSYAGEYLQYEIPDYELIDAEKVSNTHYKMRIVKRTEREAYLLKNRNDYSLGFHSPLVTFRETAYTYNVINNNGSWYVDTIEDIATPICYTDNTYQTKYVRKDNKSSKSNGNCPGLSNSER